MQPIIKFTDHEGTLWMYADGSFWAKQSPTDGSGSVLLFVPAMANGTPDICDDGTINKQTVETDQADILGRYFSAQ